MLGAVVPQVCCVLSRAARLLFNGRGLCAVTGSRVHARATSTFKGVTVCAPSAPTSLDVAHTGSRADCSLPVRTLCFSTALQIVGSDTPVQAA